MPSLIIGLASASLIVLNTLIGIVPMLILALLKALLPVPALRRRCGTGVRWIARCWALANRRILHALTGTEWDIRGREHILPQRSTLIICNHQSWVDIPALMELMLEKAPFFTFFLKRELFWVPLLGLAWWALDYPFMRRYSRAELERRPQLRGKDLEITRIACDKLQDRKVTLINYVEGTRFTQRKHDQQQSPFSHLLKPRAGGVAFVLSAMHQQIDTVLDVTIVYADGSVPSFWHLLSGQIGRVVMEVRAIPVPEALREGDYQQDESFRAAFQDWINSLWQHKDQRITALRQQAQA